MRDDQPDEEVARRLADLNVAARVTVRTETGSYVTGTVTQVIRETGGRRLRLDDCHTDIPEQMQYLGDPKSIVTEFNDLEGRSRVVFEDGDDVVYRIRDVEKARERRPVHRHLREFLDEHREVAIEDVVFNHRRNLEDWLNWLADHDVHEAGDIQSNHVRAYQRECRDRYGEYATEQMRSVCKFVEWLHSMGELKMDVEVVRRPLDASDA
ncbi:hypothetical protein [Halorubellus sp. PRR65]|uniref:hypothetical protein n=1 Tax=Halorubellus sp. PRR65 TaxID=3098148 RepID=UPI002B25D459|nr:hypothetical protein [Halorubellus sp. PRR65]